MSLRNIQIPSNLISDLGVEQVIDITDALPKLKKNGKVVGWDGLNQPRQLEALTDIVWHHSGMHLADGCTADSHANTHVRAGEGGNPYHLWLKDGQWYQCNDLLTFTYGVASNNPYTVHVCVEGCYAPKDGKQADELSEENLKAMIAMELTIRQLLPNYKASNGHNYYRSTLCPGFSMTKFREEVAKFAILSDERNNRENRVRQAALIAQRVVNLYNRANDPGFEWKDAALEKIEDIARYMKEKDYLNP